MSLSLSVSYHSPNPTPRFIKFLSLTLFGVGDNVITSTFPYCVVLLQYFMCSIIHIHKVYSVLVVGVKFCQNLKKNNIQIRNIRVKSWNQIQRLFHAFVQLYDFTIVKFYSLCTLVQLYDVK